MLGLNMLRASLPNWGRIYEIYRDFAMCSINAPASACMELRPVSKILFGAGMRAQLGEEIRKLAPLARRAVLFCDPALERQNAQMTAQLEQQGLEILLFSDITGEPKHTHVGAAIRYVRERGADIVLCMGGGSVMDVGKIAASFAKTEDSPLAFADKTLPEQRLPKICLPTTAGTGSELSSTNIFSRADGTKFWIWGNETKPETVILDPELTYSLPPRLTAWTGCDAFVHALESCTNIYQHEANNIYAHKALALISVALETAVHQPQNIKARADMLLGSALAGIAIDNCSAGLAHNISHALAALGPVHHGLATAIGLEIVLAWQTETDETPFAAAAAACGLGRDARALPEWYAEFLDKCGVDRRLPKHFAQFSTEDLFQQMTTTETNYQRLSSARPPKDADMRRFAEQTLARVASS